MMKKILAVAIASAFAAPAFAATANVDISGKMAFDVTKASGTGTANENTYHLMNNNSRFTLKGSEDLGGGMKAGFSTTYGFSNVSGGGIGSQDTYVFLGGGWGEVRAGIHDNLVKAIGRSVDLFGDQSSGDARHSNVVAYLSPNFAGFQAAVGVGMDETKASNGGQLTMATLTYKNGPLYAGLGYHKRDNNASAAAGTATIALTTVIGVTAGGAPVFATTTTAVAAVVGDDETALRLGISYNLGNLRFVGLYQNVENVNGVAAADIKTWGLGAGYKMGAITVKGQYYDVNDDRANRDSKVYALGADYAFSKRTVAQLTYAKFKNSTAANRGGAAATGGSDVLAIANGADPSRISLGLVHNF